MLQDFSKNFVNWNNEEPYKYRKLIKLQEKFLLRHFETINVVRTEFFCISCFFDNLCVCIIMYVCT